MKLRRVMWHDHTARSSENYLRGKEDRDEFPSDAAVSCMAIFTIALPCLGPATPDLGSTFTGWSGAHGAECAKGSVVVNADKTCTATFMLNPPPVITTTSLPASTKGVAYSQTLSRSGGTAPFTWTVVSGTLPDGLSLGSGGVISGTPTTAGTTSSFTVRLTDALARTVTQDLSIRSSTSRLRSSGGGGALDLWLLVSACLLAVAHRKRNKAWFA